MIEWRNAVLGNILPWEATLNKSTIWANEMNFIVIHVTGADLIAQPINLQIQMYVWDYCMQLQEEAFQFC